MSRRNKALGPAWDRTVKVFFGQKQPERQRQLRNWKQWSYHCPPCDNVPSFSNSVSQALSLGTAFQEEHRLQVCALWMTLLLLSGHMESHSFNSAPDCNFSSDTDISWNFLIALEVGKLVLFLTFVLQKWAAAAAPKYRYFASEFLFFHCDRDMGVIAGLYFCLYG